MLKSLLHIFATYFALAVFISALKIIWNYLVLWKRLDWLYDLTAIEMHLIIIINAAVFGFTVAAIVLVFLKLHAFFSAHKVNRTQKKLSLKKLKQNDR